MAFATRGLSHKTMSRLFLFPAVQAWFTFGLLPVVYSLYLSLRRIIQGFPGLGERFLWLDNYVGLRRDPAAAGRLKGAIRAIPLIVAKPFFQRRCVIGLTGGAVKG